MAKITGKNGAVSFGGTVVKITKWSLEIATETIDVTDSASTNKEYIACGRNDWSGTFEGYVEEGDAGLSLSTASAAINLTTAANHLWSGSAFIKRITTTTNVPSADAVTYQYEFHGTGLLSVNAGDSGGYEMAVS